MFFLSSSNLRLLTIRAKPKKLQPMGLNGETTVLGDLFYERVEVVTTKVFGLPAMPAQQQMVMSHDRCHISMTAIWLVNPLNQPCLL